MFDVFRMTLLCGRLVQGFGVRVPLVDTINCPKFYRTWLRGLDSVRGRILTIPIGLRCRF